MEVESGDVSLNMEMQRLYALYNLNYFDVALTEAERLNKQFPNAVDLALLRAELMAKLEKPKGASQIWQRIEEDLPGSAAAMEARRRKDALIPPATRWLQPHVQFKFVVDTESELHQSTLFSFVDILVNKGILEDVEARKLLAHHFEVELPFKLSQIADQLKATFEPEEALLDSLAGKEILREKNLENVAAVKKIIKDPLPNWLLLQKFITEAQLHETFLEMCSLPPVEGFDRDKIKILGPVLPPGFSKQHGCFVLQADQDQGLVLGLSQLPTNLLLSKLYNRLAHRPVFFKAITLSKANRLRDLV